MKITNPKPLLLKPGEETVAAAAAHGFKLNQYQWSIERLQEAVIELVTELADEHSRRVVGDSKLTLNFLFQTCCTLVKETVARMHESGFSEKFIDDWFRRELMLAAGMNKGWLWDLMTKETDNVRN